ncbi:unnamed protein product [Agarophyton chilense]
MSVSVPTTNVLDLSDDVIVIILQNLSGVDLARVSQVSKRLRRLALHPSLWKKACFELSNFPSRQKLYCNKSMRSDFWPLPQQNNRPYPSRMASCNQLTTTIVCFFVSKIGAFNGISIPCKRHMLQVTVLIWTSAHAMSHVSMHMTVSGLCVSAIWIQHSKKFQVAGESFYTRITHILSAAQMTVISVLQNNYLLKKTFLSDKNYVVKLLILPRAS